MRKHTPGPWHISGAAEGRGYSISSKRGLIAFVRDDTHPLADVREGQAKANADVISTAPDLLHCCKAFIDWVTDGRIESDETYRLLVDAMRKTIAKAEGQ